MNNPSVNPQDPDVFFREAFNRNIGILNEDEQNKLRHVRVAIAGLGGVGGFHLMAMVRLGIGAFHIADLDEFELSNIQRQFGAQMNTLGRNKAEVMKEMAMAVNPHLDMKIWSNGVVPDNVDSFFDQVDVYVDGIDFFSFETRRMLFKKAREKGIYSVTAGPLGFGSGLLVFSPDGMTFDDYFDIRDDMDELQKIIAFGVGLAPAGIHLKYLQLKNVDFKAKTGPSLASACYLCSHLASTEVLKICLKRKNVLVAPHYFQFDPYEQVYKKGYLMGGNRNLIQRLKKWYLYNKLSKK